MKKITRFLSAIILTGSTFASDKIVEDDIIKHVIQFDNGILVEYTFPNMMVFKNMRGAEISIEIATKASLSKGDPLFHMQIANDAEFRANMSYQEFQEGVQKLGGIINKMWAIRDVYAPDNGLDWERKFVLESGIVIRRQPKQIHYNSMSTSICAFEKIEFFANDPHGDIDLTEDVTLTLEMNLDQFRQGVAKLGVIQLEQRCKTGEEKVNVWPIEGSENSEEADKNRRCHVQ